MRPYLALNHPFFPLNQFAVCVGDAGIRPKAKPPTTKVISPCRFKVNRSVCEGMGIGESHFYQEQPPPPSVATVTPQVKDTSS